MRTIVPLILAGGSGSRMWPLSREQYPKQLLKLAGDHSLLQNTVQRLDGLEGLRDCVVVCNEEYRFLVAQQLQEIRCPATILLEPDGRNTAPAIALAAMHLRRDNPVLVVMPSDHIIQRGADFRRAVQKATSAAEDGKIVTFGIVPTEPQTGYGYIRSTIPSGADTGPVEQFIEKPLPSAAATMLAAGNHFWNSGIFVFTAQTFLDELRRHAPEVYAACEQAVRHAVIDMDFIRPQKEAFLAAPSISIDYAVMEHTDRASSFRSMAAGMILAHGIACGMSVKKTHSKM
jgi:mannose-1-phosphate guanylyltransferase/mannose-6-phosphate isomerase